MSCKATTKAGKPCKGTAISGTDYCFAHHDYVVTTEAPQSERESAQQEDNLCGHVNVHSYKSYPPGEQPLEPELEPLTCILPEGHEGRHMGMHYEYETTRAKYNRMTSPPTLIPPQITKEGEVEVYWTDEAGIPVEELEIENIVQNTEAWKKKQEIFSALGWASE